MSGALRRGSPPWMAFAYVAGMALVFLGERVFPTIGGLRAALTGAGVVLVFGVTAGRWAATWATAGGQRSVERALAALATGGALAVALYFTTTPAVERAIGLDHLAVASRHRYESAVTVAWVALALGAVVPLLFAERALFPMRRAAHVEWRRVREALLAGLTLSCAAVYGSLYTFVAGELGVKADFSYFRTATPSESTRKIAAAVSDPIDVYAFFPDLNPVGTEVTTYLRELSRGAPNLHVEVHDRLLVPELTRQVKAYEDGVVVLQRGTERETVPLGVDLAVARPKLKTLDADFQRALLKVTRPRHNAYLTVGHGELNETRATAPHDGRAAKVFREVLEQQNYSVHDLGAATGLGVQVPADASVVVVLGPDQPFLPEELDALARYAAQGGRFFVCLDPQSKTASLQPLADLFSLRISSALLANEKVHLRRRFNDSDNGILVTNRYSSHASVSTLSRIASRPVLFMGAGFLEAKPGADPSVHVDFAVRALPDTFDDENGNFVLDPPGEKKQAYPLAAAVSRPAPDSRGKSGQAHPEEMRAFVLADADAASDALLGNEANVLLVADAMHWLGGEESFAGALSTPQDVRIEHTKQKDLVWFYGTIFGAPALVLASGLLYTRRIRRSKKRSVPKEPPSKSVGDSEVAA